MKGALKTANSHKPGYIVILKLFTILEVLNLKFHYCLKKEILVEKSNELLEMSAWNSGVRSDWGYKFQSFLWYRKIGNFWMRYKTV